MTGTCGVCLQLQALRSGKLVLHGYRRPGSGRAEGRCRGVGTEPYEVSVESCREEQRRLQQKLAEVSTLIDRIDQDRLETVPRWRVLSKQWVYTSRSEVTEPEWADLTARYRHELEGQQKRIDTDLRIQTRLVEAWKPRPLPGEEGYASVQSVLFRLGAGVMRKAEALPKPTSEMIRFFKTRTAEHIKRVYKYLLKLEGLGDFSRADLAARGKAHDADKYSPAKALPYVWNFNGAYPEFC